MYHHPGDRQVKILLIDGCVHGISLLMFTCDYFLLFGTYFVLGMEPLSSKSVQALYLKVQFG